jgi:tripartite-type tricarboxylate transporter receptor subunit TctC
MRSQPTAGRRVVPERARPSGPATAAALAALAACCSIPAAYGQAAYPTRPIRLIVPYPPGAGTDFTAREVGQKLTEAWGQQVVIDNRSGAGATLGHGLGAKATPDGYTILLGTTGGMVSGPALGVKVPYDPVKHFAPIGIAVYVPYSLVVHASVPVGNVRELLDHARSMPGKLNFASPGTGTPNHLGGVLLMSLTGISMLHVPYKGGGPALTDLLAGQMQVLFASLPQVL